MPRFESQAVKLRHNLLISSLVMFSHPWLQTFICSYIREIALLRLLAAWRWLITFFKHGEQQGDGQRGADLSFQLKRQRQAAGVTGSHTHLGAGGSLDAAPNTRHFRVHSDPPKQGQPQSTDHFGKPYLPFCAPLPARRLLAGFVQRLARRQPWLV